MMLLLACADESGGPAAQDYDVDLRLGAGDYDDPGADGMVIVGPDVVVGAGEDKMFCLVGTYAGDDMGVHDLITYQNTFGHQLLFELVAPVAAKFECRIGVRHKAARILADEFEKCAFVSRQSACLYCGPCYRHRPVCRSRC